MSTLELSPDPIRRDLHRRLGDLLLDDGVITAEQLEQALLTQQAEGGRLGEVLVASGAIGEADIRRVLAQQLGIAFVDLAQTPFDGEIARRLPRSVCERAAALPIAIDGDVLVVAMANPADVFALDDVRVAAGTNVRSVLVNERALRSWISRAFDVDAQSALDDAILDGHDGRPDAGQMLVAATDAPMVRFVDGIIARAVRERASDIHVEAVESGLEVRFRVDGMLRSIMTTPRSARGGVISRLKIMADLDIAERRVPQDGRAEIVVDGHRFDLRVASLPTLHGESIVLRLLERRPARRRTVADLGFGDEHREELMTTLSGGSGLVVVCGPTGSGKTTTLGATLGELVRPELAVVTIEDPVETDLDGVKQMQVNPRAGFTFARALRATLRADPDVILVGEVRDAETARTAAEAALTGHLVLTSLHTSDAASAPIRLLDMGVEPYLVASSLVCAIAQRLVRRLCTSCREPYAPSVLELDLLGIADAARSDSLVLHRPIGCGDCAGTGYRERVAVVEMITLDATLGDMILRGVTADGFAEAARAAGSIPMLDDARSKVLEGITDRLELVRAGVLGATHR